jgi:hypothetical protein
MTLGRVELVLAATVPGPLPLLTTEPTAKAGAAEEPGRTVMAARSFMLEV